jgi:predicted nucleic acid-binding protein
MIFLDTDILSYYFSGNAIIRDKLLKAIQSGKKICLTCINVYEILKGLKYKNNINKENLFRDFLKQSTICGFDDNSISHAANIYADLRSKGRAVGDADILIASIVISNGGILVSNNQKHYEGISHLNLENWME